MVIGGNSAGSSQGLLFSTSFLLSTGLKKSVNVAKFNKECKLAEYKLAPQISGEISKIFLFTILFNITKLADNTPAFAVKFVKNVVDQNFLPDESQKVSRNL
ncbi:MAG: hypothetical protein LBK68_07675 [Candidatus Margulisbacteria bacterium]|nr:hypothetical protein [Candidatus Margulisiibacteriota bacterium]